MFKNLKVTIILILLLSTSTASASSEDQYNYQSGEYFDTTLAWKTIKQSALAIPSDLTGIVMSPFKNPSETMKYATIVAGLITIDKPLTNFYQKHIEAPLDIYKFPTIFYDSAYTHGADSWLVFGTLGHYLAGFALGDEKSQVTSIMAMKAIGYSYAFSHVLLKAIPGRNRPMSDLDNCIDSEPSHTCDPYDFHPFQPFKLKSKQERTALPSFHLTMYFSVAKVYQEMYDDYWLPYGALAIIFASGIKGHKHWISDMVAGGIVGTVIGHQIVSNYRTLYQQSQKSDFTILPTRNGIELNYRF